MKITFNHSQDCHRTSFYHRRSESEIIVESTPDGVQVMFVDEVKQRATLELFHRSELDELTKSLDGINDKIRRRDARGFCDEGTVLSIRYNNYGDPFEECIEFTFTIADAGLPWEEQQMSVNLDINSKAAFLEAIAKCL